MLCSVPPLVPELLMGVKGSQGNLRGVKGSQEESRGVKGSPGESRGVQGSQGESRGVKGNQGDLIFNFSTNERSSVFENARQKMISF